MTSKMQSDRKALIVEDDKRFTEFVSAYLTAASYSPTTVHTLEAATSYSERFDIYVSDGSFPLREGMQPDRDAGMRFYGHVTEHHPNSRFVFYSSNDDLETLCQKQGIDFVRKDDPGKLRKYLEI